MSLADHYGGTYFKPGDHRVRVRSVKEVTSGKKGTPGLEVIYSDGEREIKDTLWLTEKAYFRIANLCAALGMSDQEMRSYEPDDPSLQKWMRGKECMIVVVKGTPNQAGKSYSEVEDFYAVPKAGQVAAKPSPQATPPASEPETVPPSGDDIPF